MTPQRIAALIDQSPMNRGMIGSEWFADPCNTAIAMGDNVMLFELQAEGLCEFHWLATGTKGRKAVNDTRAAMRQIFTETTARIIYGLVSVTRPDSALMARWIGAKCVGEIMTDCGRCKVFTITPDILEGLS